MLSITVRWQIQSEVATTSGVVVLKDDGMTEQWER